MRNFLVILLVLVVSSFAKPSYDGITITKVDRNIDLTTQVARVNTQIELSNTGSQGFFLAIQNKFANKLAYISVNDLSANLLAVTKDQQDTESVLYKVSVPKGDKIIIVVREVFIHSMEAYPVNITQQEFQLVRYYDNHFFYSPYKVKEQKTLVKLSSTLIESQIEQPPTKLDKDTLTYGPYYDIPPFTSSEMYIHFENNNPFYTITKLVRELEISHWGNLAVEETVDLQHDGAHLKGSFSRFDYMRNPRANGISAIRMFKIRPLKGASDVYYRDDIGNISTSFFSVRDNDIPLLELIPRFPLFGGWKTSFYTGYNVPLSNALGYDYQESRYILNTTFAVDWDDIVIDDIQIKIILPEGARDIEIYTPFPIDSNWTEIRVTYLDTTGRPVIILQKNHIVGEHNQYFQIAYRFSSLSLLQEPLLLIIGFFTLFLISMLYIRVEFKIQKREDDTTHNKKLELYEKVKSIQVQRAQKYDTKLLDTVSQDKNQQKEEKKKIENDLTNLEKEFTKIIKELSEIDEDLAAKANAIQLKESEKAGYYNQLYTLLRQNTSPVISEADKKKVHDLTFKFDRADEELSFLIGDLVSS